MCLFGGLDDFRLHLGVSTQITLQNWKGNTDSKPKLQNGKVAISQKLLNRFIRHFQGLFRSTIWLCRWSGTAVLQIKAGVGQRFGLMSNVNNFGLDKSHAQTDTFVHLYQMIGRYTREGARRFM